MVFAITVIVGVLAALGHLTEVWPFNDLVSIPVAALSAMGLMGFIGRLKSPIRKHLISIVPKALKFPSAIVWLTGVLELAGAIGLLIAPTRIWAAAGFLLLLVVVFPANVIDAQQKGENTADFWKRILVRGGEQVVFLALAIWALAGTLG